MSARILLLTLLLLTGARPASAQEVRAAVVGDSLRVGDVVPVAVRVTIEPGQRVSWPDTLPLPVGADLENAARVRERVDTLPDGRVEVTGIYALTPWRPGTAELGDLRIGLVSGDEAVRTITASLPALEVLSVLPEDTTGIEPRPSKGVLGPSWSRASILLLILLVLAVVALLVWWLRRRRRVRLELDTAPTVPPRERALAALREAREAGWIERGEWKELYTRVAGALRDYLAEIDAEWGEDLTTTELAARLKTRVDRGAAAELVALLRSADQVKFARREPTREAAEADARAAEAWVTAWPPEPSPEQAREEGEEAA